MRIETLPSPGPIGSGLQLRTQAAKAISYVEIMAGMAANGKSSTAKSLGAFFAACKAAADAVTDTTLPTVTARAIPANAPTKVRITFSEPMDTSVVPAISAFALAGVAKTISAVAFTSDTVLELTVTVAYVAGGSPTVAYTAPGTNALRDRSGNLLATFAAAAIVNNVA